jgi:hypothetical protein
MSEEWGPWIEHDGSGCPCVGEYVEVDFLCWRRGIVDGYIIPRVDGLVGWKYKGFDPKVIRYRVRAPRALIELREMVENLPAPSKPKVDA